VSEVAAYRLSGAGNDFLALVEPAAEPTTETIRAWCRRGLSLGADGLLALERTAQGAGMRYWNADGSCGALCLNGSRCAAQLAFHLGWGEGEGLLLDTGAGQLAAHRLNAHSVSVALPAIIQTPVERRLVVTGQAFSTWWTKVGVEHLVVPWPSRLDTVAISTLGKAFRAHPDLGACGANIDFVRWETDHRFDIRSFERGVEAETLACGTGVVAAVAAGIAAGTLEPPATARTAGGCLLRVEGKVEHGCLEQVRLAGDARIVARCQLFEAASLVPAQASWY